MLRCGSLVVIEPKYSWWSLRFNPRPGRFYDVFSAVTRKSKEVDADDQIQCREEYYLHVKQLTSLFDEE